MSKQQQIGVGSASNDGTERHPATRSSKGKRKL